MTDVELSNTIQHEGCDHRATAQASDEGDECSNARAVHGRSTECHAGQVGPRSRTMAVLVEGLINKHQSGLVKHALFSHPAPPGADHIGSLLLRCAQTFWKRHMT